MQRVAVIIVDVDGFADGNPVCFGFRYGLFQPIKSGQSVVGMLVHHDDGREEHLIVKPESTQPQQEKSWEAAIKEAEAYIKGSEYYSPESRHHII